MSHLHNHKQHTREPRGVSSPSNPRRAVTTSASMSALTSFPPSVTHAQIKAGTWFDDDKKTYNRKNKTQFQELVGYYLPRGGTKVVGVMMFCMWFGVGEQSGCLGHDQQNRHPSHFSELS